MSGCGPQECLPAEISARLKRDPSGLVAAIIQSEATDEVLMLGWMDDRALARTLSEGRVVLWSRSRREYWRKGDTSGHAQYVKSVALDCDGDALLVRVDQVGAACHRGTPTCFTSGQLPAAVGHRSSVGAPDTTPRRHPDTALQNGPDTAAGQVAPRASADASAPSGEVRP